MTIITDPEFDVPESDDENSSEEAVTGDTVTSDDLVDDTDDENSSEDADDGDDDGDIDDTAAEADETDDNTEDAADEQPAEARELTAAEVVDSVVTETPAAVGAEQSPIRPAPALSADRARPEIWTGRQALTVIQRALAVFVVLGIIGYGLGALRGGSHTARAEFVYTLDESVPDSFLREDRRLLTQVVTFRSDAVLTPVAEEFNLTVDQLRAKIDVQTLDLSEVLRLDVTDADAGRAEAINRAVLDQYLRVLTDATPAGGGEELAATRAEIAAELADADASRLALTKAQEQDAALEVQQESLQRRINAGTERVAALQQSIDASSARGTTGQQNALTPTLAAGEADLVDLEAQLVAVSTQRAELATATTAEPALLREIERLEAKLSTIDSELAERELAPLVASPIRELSDPIVVSTSQHLAGLQGMALGLLAALPLAVLVAYVTRKRQLWFD